ncbi:MAG: diguanylate cyclase, partial [Oscillospiraceae bacterium]|nr:diguanylate cyclase [Oscillospiraceae bacterium]
MSSDKKVNKKQSLFIILMLAVIVLAISIISLGLGAIYSNRANISIEENAKSILIPSTRNISDYTDMRLQSSLNTLSGYAVSFSHADEMTEEVILDYIEHCLLDGKFTEIAYISIDGESYGEMSINARSVVTDSLNGEKVILTSQSLYTVPVYKKDTVIGALVGKSDPNNYNATTFNMYGVTQNCFVVNSDGVVLNGAQEPVISLNVGDNLPVILERENDANFFKTALSQKDAEISEIVTIDKVRYFMTVCSMNTNNWTMVSFVPCSAVRDSSANVVMPLNYLVVVLAAVFLILAAYLLYYTYRIRKKANEIVDENNKINYIDDLTGYASWKSFMENYDKKLLDTSLNLAFLCLDIDKFKTVNDTLGYEGGNNI